MRAWRFWISIMAVSALGVCPAAVPGAGAQGKIVIAQAVENIVFLPTYVARSSGGVSERAFREPGWVRNRLFCVDADPHAYDPARRIQSYGQQGSAGAAEKPGRGPWQPTGACVPVQRDRRPPSLGLLTWA
jgi:hypothetical protein